MFTLPLFERSPARDETKALELSKTCSDQACGTRWRGFPVVRKNRAARSRSSNPAARLCCLEDRADDPVMGSATAQIARKSQPDLGLARLLVAVEQRLGEHDHAGGAVAALCRLLRYESGLQGVRPFEGTEAFERGDLRLPERVDWRDAGAHRCAVDEHRAGAALAKPAAELRGIEAKIIAQHVEQRRVRLCPPRCAPRRSP